MNCPKKVVLLSLLPSLNPSIYKIHVHFWHYSNIPYFKKHIFVCSVNSRDVLLYIFSSSVPYL